MVDDQVIDRINELLDSPDPETVNTSMRIPGALRDVAALAVNTVSAKLKCATVTVNSDGPTALTLLQLRPKSAVTEGGETVETVPASGTATVSLATGTSALQVCSASYG